MDDSHHQWFAPERRVYRSFGTASVLERIGVGFSEKSGVLRDEVDARFPCYSLVHVLHGHGTYHDGQGTVAVLKAGSCFLRRPDTVHSSYIDPRSGWVECWLDCGPTLYRTMVQLRCLHGLDDAWDGRVREDLLPQLRQLIDDLCIASDDSLPGLMGRWLELHAAFVRDCRAGPEGDDIADACRFLADDGNRLLSLRAFCRQRNLAYDRFRKRFQQGTGFSPEQYRIRRRMERACLLLENGDHSIKMIADMMGYSSPYEFSAQFRRYMGQAPSHYRKRQVGR